jgi:hypothetical protein
MALALHCDAPSCEAWIENNYTNKQKYIILSHNGEDRHFCSWNCVITFVNEVDVLDGFESK